VGASNGSAPALPLLASVGGSLSVTSNGTLSSFAAPLLASVGREFNISSNSSLRSVKIGDGMSVGGDGNDVAEDVVIARNAMLCVEAAPDDGVESVFELFCRLIPPPDAEISLRTNADCGLPVCQ
jgi:hypothetical protein